VSSIVPLAYSLAKNISQHAAGWLYGYLKELGWSKESITKLLTKSFHTESVRAAQESSWDRKTGVVTSTHISEEDQHLRQLQNSWVDLNLGRPDSYKELDATVEVGDMMAFNFEEALSLKSLNTTNSGLEGYDDTSTIATHEEMEKEDELEEEYAPEEEVLVEDASEGSDDYDDPEEDIEALFEDAKQDLDLPEGYEPYQPPQDGMEEDLEEEGVDEMDEGYVDDIEYEEYDPSAEEDADDEDFESLPIRALFPDTDEFRENLLNLSVTEQLPPAIVPLAEKFYDLLAVESMLEARRSDLLEEDEADPTVAARTIAIEEELAVNNQEILDIEEAVREIMRNLGPKPPDEGNETRSPRPENEQAVEHSTNGAAPVETATQNPPDATFYDAHRAEGKGG
jgi:hypothetical protein